MTIAVEEHLALAHWFAARYRTRQPADAEELFGAALLGLCRAARSFDPSRGCTFATHATWQMRSTVGRALAALPVVRLPRESTVKVLSLAARRSRPDDDDHPGDLGPPAPSADLDAAPDAHALLAHLDARGRRLLEGRYGFDGRGERSFAELAQAEGVTPERCRQLVGEALATLRAVTAATA